MTVPAAAAADAVGWVEALRGPGRSRSTTSGGDPRGRLRRVVGRADALANGNGEARVAAPRKEPAGVHAA